VGAADTDDFSRWLIARIWHNPKSTDQLWAVIELASRAASFPLPRPQQLLRRLRSPVGTCRPRGEATGRSDVHRYGIASCSSAVAASRAASPPKSPAAHRGSSRATGSCYPSPRRHGSSSSKSQRHWKLVAGNKRRASCPLGVQPRECRDSLGPSTRPLPAHEVAVPATQKLTNR